MMTHLANGENDIASSKVVGVVDIKYSALSSSFSFVRVFGFLSVLHFNEAIIAETSFVR